MLANSHFHSNFNKAKQGQGSNIFGYDNKEKIVD